MFDFQQLTDPAAWVALLTLTLLEIVLGIDNIIFISILSSRLPEDQQKKARNIGLTLALVTRILLLLTISWMAKLTKDLFEIAGHGFSGRDLILLGGGLFLLFKATHEIHNKLEGEEESADTAKAKGKGASLPGIIAQILVIDVVFSLDSVITAIGMAEQLWVMIAAVIIAIVFMLIFAGKLSRFVDRHPTVKMLALAFLVLIGVNLIAEGFGHHLPKGYTYFAMAFSVGVEMLNLRLRKKTTPPVHLRTQAP